jgi:hypothetical protein
MRTPLVTLSVIACAFAVHGVSSAQQPPKPETGTLPANGGAVIDKTRSAAPAASSPASAASGVLRLKPAPASAPR